MHGKNVATGPLSVAALRVPHADRGGRGGTDYAVLGAFTRFSTIPL